LKTSQQEQKKRFVDVEVDKIRWRSTQKPYTANYLSAHDQTFQALTCQGWAMTRTMNYWGTRTGWNPIKCYQKSICFRRHPKGSSACVSSTKAINKKQSLFIFFKTFISQMNRRQSYNRDWKKKNLRKLLFLQS
jgi:hypothetical protein